MAQKIVPHLWFDNDAGEAVETYVRAFAPLGESRVDSSVVLPDTPSGDALNLLFTLAGHRFVAINGGPYFRPNPSISFFVNFDPSLDPRAREHLDGLWQVLSDGGEVLMELGEYPFSAHYGWLRDRFGVSWQLILTDPDGDPRPVIVPSLLFTGERAGQALDARDFWMSVFEDSHAGLTAPYPAGAEPEVEGTLMFGDFTLAGQWFAAADSALEHSFSFDEGVSLLVECEDQAEIDRLWEALSAVPAAEQCGWLKDRFGVSWQIAPAEMTVMMETGSPDQLARLTQAFLPMHRLDLATLRAAWEGREG
ncbi:VOC family protein [Actinomyces sp.]|uniref:VOC family protein n=1 Tax=Actinomyces sp. TaxID=29317 RepID=UPI00289A85F8|nr:VOC family protein [Actinomyces sp.]